MIFQDKAEKIANKFTSKAGKLLAFWGTITALVALIPTIIGGLVWLWFFFVDIANISTYVKEFKAISKYNTFCEMQTISGLHEEMDTQFMYGVELQKTNNGDLWYFTDVKVNGKDRPVIYSANIKRKGKKIKLDDGTYATAHIYVQNMAGEHEWILDR